MKVKLSVKEARALVQFLGRNTAFDIKNKGMTEKDDMCIYTAYVRIKNSLEGKEYE